MNDESVCAVYKKFIYILLFCVEYAFYFRAVENLKYVYRKF